jgi:ferredoxin
MKIMLDVPVCQAYGLCVMEAPDFFEIDEEADKARLLKHTATGDDAAAVRAAATACPVFAISLGEGDADTSADGGPGAGSAQ